MPSNTGPVADESIAAPKLGVSAVVLTMGDRPEALRAAIQSLVPVVDEIVIVWNGVPADSSPLKLLGGTIVDLELPNNEGIPGGRDAGLRVATGDLVLFLDDDAALEVDSIAPAVTACTDEPRLAVVAFRIADEQGLSSRRHVPHLRASVVDERPVAYFLGGASLIRRRAYLDVGGYWSELFYSHEEIELSWRLLNGGWSIRYLPAIAVFHPRTSISRHARGWNLTGRNRVLIARRDLPWPVAFVHVTVWLVLGLVKAPTRDTRKAYLGGWRSGWREPVARVPIRWATVWRATRLGRPPLI